MTEACRLFMKKSAVSHCETGTFRESRHTNIGKCTVDSVQNQPFATAAALTTEVRLRLIPLRSAGGLVCWQTSSSEALQGHLVRLGSAQKLLPGLGAVFEAREGRFCWIFMSGSLPRVYTQCTVTQWPIVSWKHDVEQYAEKKQISHSLLGRERHLSSPLRAFSYGLAPACSQICVS